MTTGSTYHRLEPEATGTVGPGATWTRDAHGRRVQGDPLRCELVGWLGDDLVDVTPDLVVTSTLTGALRSSGLSGVELAPAVVTRGEEFVSYAGPLPETWERLVLTGDASAGDDLAVDADGGGLLVRPRALALLNDHRVRRAVLTPAPGSESSEEVLRFRRRQEEVGAEAEGENGLGDEAARLATLADGMVEPPPPTSFRTNAGREVTGDLALAASALGRPLEDDAVLAVVRLMGRPLTYDAGRTAYLSEDGSVVVHLRTGVVSGVELVLRPHRNARRATYSRPEHLFGVDVITRETAHGAWGEPASTKGSRRTRDEYRLGRVRVLVHWDDEDEPPAIVVVGTKA